MNNAVALRNVLHRKLNISVEYVLRCVECTVSGSGHVRLVRGHVRPVTVSMNLENLIFDVKLVIDFTFLLVNNDLEDINCGQLFRVFEFVCGLSYDGYCYLRLPVS